MSALLDGQLSPDETERAWAHVHQCHACRDLVEHEGWVKTRLAGLALGSSPAPGHLKGSLLGAFPVGDRTPAGQHLAGATGGGPGPGPGPGLGHRSRRNVGLVAIGGGAVGVAVVGVLALGAAPADAPTIERRAPVTSINGSTTPPTPLSTPGRRPGLR